MALVDSALYNSLPSLEEANAEREAQNLDKLIQGQIRDVFIKYGAQKAFTLYLQHGHHQLRDNEAIVKVQGTAHLMDGQQMNDIERVGNKLVPTTWMGNTLVPMEFAVVPTSVSTPTFAPGFIAELADILTSNGCNGLFGIDTLNQNDWTELSIGNASVVVPSNGNEREDSYIPVAIAFDEKNSGFRVHGKCGKDHKHTSKPVTPKPVTPKPATRICT
ncbi:hypothetical protein F4803DRAFT_542987 [Xylaria telfairii]|nr:hypothetical protein F4803DRAFT_542987 [Xylaria telfairii]